MRARRTEHTDQILKLPGGTEDNDLHYYVEKDEHDHDIICSVWTPTHAERLAIAAGENIRLLVWWNGRFAPVAMDLTDEAVKGEEGAQRVCCFIVRVDYDNGHFARNDVVRGNVYEASTHAKAMSEREDVTEALVIEGPLWLTHDEALAKSKAPPEGSVT